jgi:hypothetical protein
MLNQTIAAPIHSKVRGRGDVLLEILRADGRIERFLITNMVVAGGESYAASRAVGTDTGVISHMAPGTGNTAAASGDTALVAEIADSRVAVTATSDGNTAKYVAVFAPGVGTGAWQELGLFNAAAAGTMTNRTVFGTKTKDAGDQITVTWTVEYTNAS